MPSNKVEPKKFNITMSPDDLANFKAAIEKGEASVFIKQYMFKHKKDSNISGEEDVYTLALTRAIATKDAPLTKDLLSGTKHSNSVLVAVDAKNNNPIYAALIAGNNDILKQISEYLHKCSFNTKFSMSDDDFIGKMSRVVASPRSESYNPETYIEKFLRPVYTTEDIDKIIDIVGRDNIYYHHHLYKTKCECRQ